MIKSMTGYGGAKGSAEGLSLSIELKSVNNRYLDVSVKLPRSFLFAEELIKPPSAGISAAARWTFSSRWTARPRMIWSSE